MFSLNGAHSQQNQLDTNAVSELFNDWNKSDHPGGVVLVAKNGEVLYSRAYGLASLEFGVRNTIETQFNIASITKQFTAFGILLLESEGKLSLDDDVHKYLPEVPDFGHLITIRHLLTHTSGLRSLHGMLEMAGWGAEDPRTTEDHWRFVLNQKELNFKPGEHYRYCNTGYILLGHIIESVTGQTYPTWMAENVFSRFGMDQTYVEDNFNNVVPGNARSYRKTENGWEKQIEGSGYFGTGNIHSTVGDLHKWMLQYHAPSSEYEALFSKQKTRGVLNNGDTISYAFGIDRDYHAGHQRIQHGGANAGFRSFIAVYPEEQLEVIVLANFSSADVKGLNQKIAEMLLPSKRPNEVESIADDLNTNAFSSYAGFYWNEMEGYMREIKWENDTLWYKKKSSSIAMLPSSERKFYAVPESMDFQIEFISADTMISYSRGFKSGTLHRFQPTTPSDELMKSYSGIFYSDELKTTYEIRVKEGEVEVYHNRRGWMQTLWIMDDVVVAPWPVGTIRFFRNQAGEVDFLTFSNTRAYNVRFDRINE